MLNEEYGVFMCLNFILTRLLIERLNFIYLCKEFHDIVQLLIIRFYLSFQIFDRLLRVQFPLKSINISQRPYFEGHVYL